MSRSGSARRAPARLLRPLAVATLVANIAIVVTGGAVRLTGSGLGCPTWPRCTAGSFVPQGALGMHGAIEFGNRMLTFLLAAIAIATWVAAMRDPRRRRSVRVLATVLALGIPGQAVIGGFTVLTDLDPWVVSLHLMLSMAMIALAVVLVSLVYDVPWPRPAASPGTRRLATVIAAVAAVVLYLGTVVTGAGPHAGHLAPEDLAGDRVLLVRNGLDPQLVSHVHAGSVYLLVVLTVALLVAARRPLRPDPSAAAVLRAGTLLLAVEVAQGAVGFTQYFLDLPELLVGIHLLGAALLSAAVAWLVVQTRGRAPASPAAQPVGQPSTSASTATARKSSAR